MDEISLHKYCERIEEMIERGRYEEAVAHGKYVLKRYPKHLMTYRLLGRAMLEAGQDARAVDIFQRVLSADPEATLAWTGLSKVYERQGKLDAAAGCQERAFELAPHDETVIERLRRLYGRVRASEPRRVRLTRGALARLHLKSGLHSRAISELHGLLEEHADRVDLSVTLGEALWRNGQRLEASEVCHQVLHKLPYCLKANLILGEIWTDTGRTEGDIYLRRAAAVDPENRMAQELFGAKSPLPPQDVRIRPLVYEPPVKKERPDRLADLEELPPAERGAALLDPPEWLRDQVPSEAPDDALEALEALAAEAPSSTRLEGEEMLSADDALAWLKQLAAEREEPPEEPPTPSGARRAEDPAELIAAKRAHVKEHARDYDAWLELARALWKAGEHQAAVDAYGQLIESGQLLDEVIQDLERCAQQEADIRTLRALGDAYAKDNRLEDALNTYYQALERCRLSRRTDLERTLIIIKPDALERGLIGEIIARFERRGLRIAAMKMIQIDEALARRHYAVHEGKPFYEPLIQYITSSPVVVMVLEGKDAIQIVRRTMGATHPAEAAPGTIRADFGLEIGRNLVHGSDGPDTAAFEIPLFFDEDEILSYKRDIDRWIFE